MTAANTKSNLTLYDCDEGNIRLTTTDKDLVKLFYTLNLVNQIYFTKLKVVHLVVQKKILRK